MKLRSYNYFSLLKAGMVSLLMSFFKIFVTCLDIDKWALRIFIISV